MVIRISLNVYLKSTIEIVSIDENVDDSNDDADVYATVNRI